MARSGSDSLADTLNVQKSASEAHSQSARLSDAETKRRHSVPIKRNQRLYLQLPVLVYNLSAGNQSEPLLEAARSVVIYPGGAAVSLAAAVNLGQELLLVNPQNKVRAVCRVAAVEASKNGSQPVVTVEFTKPAAKFWGVIFPPEKADPVERKLPRLPRRSRRVESAQPIEVCRGGESGADVKDACITQNLSRDGLYFTTGQTGYQEGMRLTIGFLHHSDLFATNANYAAQIVRVDAMPDGRAGVAVKLVGTAAKAPAVAASSQSKAVSKGTGPGVAVVPGDTRSPRAAGIQPVPQSNGIEQLPAKQAKALAQLGPSTGKLCTGIAGALRKSSGEFERSVSASARVTISLGARAAVLLAKLFSGAAALLRGRVLELRPVVSWTRSWFKESAKQTALGVVRIRTALTLPKDDGLHELGAADFHDESL